MHRTRIKFCGITRPADAVAAAHAGADAIGLNFYKQSARYVSVEQAREILRALPAMVSPIGLFVNCSVDQIRQTAGSLSIRTVQLHGDEMPGQLAELSDFKVIKAVRCDVRNLSTTLQIWRDAAAKWNNLIGVLLETAHTPELGGSGVENDWAGIESILKSKASLPPLIAAGGLTPENVGTVIRLLHPWAVDVSTGIEESRGIKSVDKMRRFAEQVCLADQSGN